MRLADALRLKPGQVVAFTGAGGKSTCLRKLATELAGELPVVLTTTTKILHDQTDLASSHLIMNQPQAMMELRRLLRTQTSVLLTGRASAQKKKWFGMFT
jgi:ABC-type hemin transport system ATPase subunit